MTNLLVCEVALYTSASSPAQRITRGMTCAFNDHSSVTLSGLIASKERFVLEGVYRAVILVHVRQQRRIVCVMVF